MFTDADATNELTLAGDSDSEIEKAENSYSFLIWLTSIIVIWEISKATLKLWAEKLLKATGLRTKTKKEKAENSVAVKKDKQNTVKITTRDVGIQAQCTYKWKWETPRFHVLPEESTGAFV